MSLRINKGDAKQVLLEESEKALDQQAPADWVQRVERLSEACEASGIKTHIAYLGTVFLAKAVDLSADAFSIKAGAGTPGAFSARSLGHGVLVPNAALLGIDLGVTGREPLNNQPYFRHDRVSRDMVVHGGATESVGILCDVLAKLDAVKSEAEARSALRAFIQVRRAYRPIYPEADLGPLGLTSDGFVDETVAFVHDKSEGGKRAQAVAAGLTDIVVGPDRVVAGRINDPDRNMPGDVGIASRSEGDWEAVFEIRDKPVTSSDVQIFAEKSVAAGVKRAAVIAVSKTQKPIEAKSAITFAAQHGVQLRVIVGLEEFVREWTFWASGESAETLDATHGRIYARLIDSEVAVDTVQEWLAMGKGTGK